MIDFAKEEYAHPDGWFSAFDMQAIYPKLIQSKRDDIYLEIGVDRGRSLSFAKKHFRGDVFGIDIQTPVQRGGDLVDGTNFIHANSLDVNWTLPIKILFIDGEHRYEQVRNEWEKYWPFVVKGGWVFFHDADDSSPEVKAFTDEIKATHNRDKHSSMAWIRKR